MNNFAGMVGITGTARGTKSSGPFSLPSKKVNPVIYLPGPATTPNNLKVRTYLHLPRPSLLHGYKQHCVSEALLALEGLQTL